jgi:hypothetical protein
MDVKMRLYSKKLHSLEELKREKHVLKYAAKHSDDTLNFNDLGKHTSTDDAAGAGMLGTLISAFGSKSMFNTVLAMAPPLLALVSKRSGRKKKNPLESLAKEVIFGYVKWKAVQMAYRGVMLFVKSNKKDDKKAKEHD